MLAGQWVELPAKEYAIRVAPIHGCEGKGLILLCWRYLQALDIEVRGV